MIKKSQFSTCPGTAKGGLIICGMNWGGKSQEADRGIETESTPWAPYFSHMDNRSSGFQTPLLTWFDLWQVAYGCSTPLDRATAQSNIFFDQSPRFLDRLGKDMWIHGITRLAEAVEQMDFSGILLVSSKVVQMIIGLSARDEVPTWNRVVGKLEWDTPRYHRLNLRFGRKGTRYVAGVSHPSCGVAHADVRDSAEEMRSWITEVLQAHEIKNRTTRFDGVS